MRYKNMARVLTLQTRSRTGIPGVSHSAGVANKYLGLGGLNRNLALRVLDAGNCKDPFPSVHSLCLCSSS